MAVNEGRDLVGAMLPTLCEKFMSGTAYPDRDARRLFDALEALECEQRIRNYRQVFKRTADIEEEVQKAAVARNWKLVVVLTNHYFTELSRVSELEVVVLLAVRQREIVDQVGTMGGVEALLSFAGHVRGIVERAVVGLQSKD